MIKTFIYKLQIFFGLYEPQIITWIKRMFEHSFKKEWFETYWAIDVHGTIIYPNYTKEPCKATYYPYAKETLQMWTKRKDIIMFTYTAAYDKQLQGYIDQFETDGIHFNYINENPEISEAKGHFGRFENKPYFNVLMDDKTGFNPETDWKPLYKLFKKYEKTGYKPDPKWDPKF